MGSGSWQGEAPSTPDDTGFASIANALPDFESRMANVEWLRLVRSRDSLTPLRSEHDDGTAFTLSRFVSAAGFALPTLAGIANRRQAFAKLRLLTFSISLLLRLAGLLLGTRTCGATGEYDNSR